MATTQPLIFRKGLDMKEAVAGELSEAYDSGLIDQVRRGHITKGQQVVFVHTGGMPALFAYAQDLGLAA